MELSTLKSLQTRIRESKGEDRELDAEIAKRIGGWKVCFGDNWIGPNGQISVPHFTTDPDGLGACVGLMRAVLPGCEWYCDRDHLFWVYRDFNLITEHRISGEKCINDCLTFLAAICAAKVAELEAQEKVG